MSPPKTAKKASKPTKPRAKAARPASARVTRVPAITPFLWFDREAEEAAEFYCDVFPATKVTSVSRYGEGSPMPSGTAMTVTLQLAGQPVILLNAGPTFKLSEAFSFFVDCKDQAEVDYYWSRLTSGGGQESMCGWLKDKYGVSWQIIPRALTAGLSHKDTRKASRTMQAMFKMRKIDVAAIEAAVAGK
jgi:predicted 3-demethylubiquinone-9 3-methyltransferase (glyoxalase superfamily)